MPELKSGDEVRAGLTVFRVLMEAEEGDSGTVEHPVNFVPPSTIREERLALTFPEIPGFRLDKEIGQGGMGVVYRATRESDGQRVAIKTIRAEANAAQKEIDRFLREATILEKLHHTNVVKSLGNGAVGPLLYLVMEYVNGPNAQQLVQQRGPMSTRAGVFLMCQALQGLAHAHDLGFVHRDFKPSNLLVGTQGKKAHRQTGGLRPGQDVHPFATLRSDDDGRNPGHASLHGAGADYAVPRRATGRRPVLGGSNSLLAADRQVPVRLRRQPGRRDVPLDPRRCASAHPRTPSGRAREGSEGNRACPAREPQDRFDSVRSFWKELREAL